MSELRAVRDALDPLVRSGFCELVERTDTSLDDIATVFLDEQYRDRIAVFHYGGHADGYQLLLQTNSGKHARLLANGFSQFLATQQGLELVVLNGCSTADQARGLLEAGVRNVVATSSAIVDEIASDFAKRLYQSLAGGAELLAAYQAAAAIILSAHGDQRDLMVGAPTSSFEQDGVPWHLYPDDGSAAHWNWGTLCNDPLFGLGLPAKCITEFIHKPSESPFLHLSHFDTAQAPLFFGRGREIRELFDRLTASHNSSIHLIHGQSGVGKSSLLAAGLLPRLSLHHDVVYRRRLSELGLVGTLASALDCETSRLVEKWHALDEDRPLTVVLDQVEEAITQSPRQDATDEFGALRTQLDAIFRQAPRRPRGNIILSFRKEYFAEIREAFASLAPVFYFVQRLERQGVIEAITAPARVSYLRPQYNLDIDDDLPEAIADSLMEDSGSQIAPVLQTLLSEMWKAAINDNPSRPRFTRELYGRIRGDGDYLGKFLRQQIEQGPKELVRSGLFLDFLYSHVTSRDTAGEQKYSELSKQYQRQTRNLPAMRDKALALYLLVEPPAEKVSEPATRLAHDALGPYLRREVRDSKAPGAVARRTLESRAAGWTKDTDGDLLDSVDLANVERGAGAMRDWSAIEHRLIAASRRARGRRHIRLAFMTAIAVISVAIALRQLVARRRQEQFALASSLVIRARADLDTGRFLTRSVLFAAEALRRLSSLNQSTVEADRVLRTGVGLLTTQDSVGLFAKRVTLADIADRAGAVAVADGDSVRVSSMTTGKSLLTFGLAKTHVLALSPDGQIVAAANSGGSLEIWRVNGETLIARHTDSSDVQQLQWSPSSKSLAVLRAGAHSVELWQPADSARTKSFPHADTVQAFSLSGAGDYLATISKSDFTLWQIASGQHIAYALPARLSDVAFSASGHCVVVASSESNLAWIWSGRRRAVGPPIRLRPGLSAVAADAACERFAFTTADGVVEVMDSVGHAPNGRFKHAAKAAGTMFSKDGRLVLTNGDDGTVRAWRTSDNVEVARMVHPGNVLQAILANDSTVASIATDGVVRHWALRAKSYPWRRALAEEVKTLAFSNDGRRVAAVGVEGRVQLWDTMATPISATRVPSPVTAASFHAGTAEITVSGFSGALHIDLATHDTLQRWGGSILAQAASAGGQVVFARVDSSILLGRLSKKDSVVLSRATSDQPSAVAFTADDSSLLIADFSGRFRLERISNHQKLFEHKLGGKVNAFAIQRAGRRFAAASDDSTAVIGELPNGRIVTTLRHSRPVLSVAISDDGRYVVTGGEDLMAHVWDTASGTELAQFPSDGAVTAVAFSPNGRLIATGGIDGSVALWEWRVEDLIGAACAYLRSDLSDAEWSAATGAAKPKPICVSAPAQQRDRKRRSE